MEGTFEEIFGIVFILEPVHICPVSVQIELVDFKAALIFSSPAVFHYISL